MTLFLGAPAVGLVYLLSRRRSWWERLLDLIGETLESAAVFEALPNIAVALNTASEARH